MIMACTREDCTVTETGICLLNEDPDVCPERRENVNDESREVSDASPLPGSGAYDLSQVRQLMSERYVRLVAILGEPDAGKTACLVSLYLLLLRDRLTGVGFADSRTLMAFEEICRGARQWNSGLVPEQLTIHTKLADDRVAGFLHLRLIEQSTQKPYDLVFPDLPGEWTSQLIANNRVGRLAFVNRADAIWLMVNGSELSNPETRHITTHRTKLLIRRVVSLVDKLPSIYLVLTRLDHGHINQQAINELHDEAAGHNITMETVRIASFSKVPDSVRPGSGIPELIATTIRSGQTEYSLWSDPGIPPVFAPPSIGLVEKREG